MHTIEGLEVPECLCWLLSRGTQHVCKHVAWKEDSGNDSKPVAHCFPVCLWQCVTRSNWWGKKSLTEQSALLFLIINSKFGKSGKMKPSKCFLNCRNFVYPCFCFHSIPLIILFQGEREKKQEKKREGGRGRRRGRGGWGGERRERILSQYFDQLKTILHGVYPWETFEKDHKVPVELLIQEIISTSASLMDRSVFLGCLVFIIWTDWNRSHKPFHWFSWHLHRACLHAKSLQPCLTLCDHHGL